MTTIQNTIFPEPKAKRSAKVIPLNVRRKIMRALEPETSDETLIKAIAQGIRQAMELLYKRHHLRVYRFAVRLTDNATLAEDIVSAVFLDVWRQAGEFQGRSQVSTWLLAIARNKAYTAFRRLRDEPLPECDVISIADPADDPEVTIVNRDRAAFIQRCLARLPANQREVIDLVYYHEKTVEEVSLIVGAPVGTVKTRMFHARGRLAELFKLADLRMARRPSEMGLPAGNLRALKEL